MLGHLGLNVPDLDTARRYYDTLLPTLLFEPWFGDETQQAYRPEGGKPGTYLFLYASKEPGTYSRHRTGLQHLAFMVPTRSAVDRAHEVAQSLGSEIIHPPRHFPEYPPPYYATFWLDPHGFLLEAVCHHDR